MKLYLFILTLFFVIPAKSITKSITKSEVREFLCEMGVAFKNKDLEKIKKHTTELTFQNFSEYTKEFTDEDRLNFLNRKFCDKRRMHIKLAKDDDWETKVELGHDSKINGYDGGFLYIIKRDGRLMINGYFKPMGK